MTERRSNGEPKGSEGADLHVAEVRADEPATGKAFPFGPVSPENPLTVVVIDDHELFSAGLEFILNAASGGYVRVVGRTADAGKAVELVRRSQPQVAIID